MALQPSPLNDAQRQLLDELLASSGLSKAQLGAILQHEADVEHLAQSAGSVVVLEGGKGSKAQYNGGLARPLPSAGRGGWATVLTQPEQKRVK